MFGLCCKRLKILVPSCSIGVDSVTRFNWFQKEPHLIRSWSSKSSSLLGSEIDVDKSQDEKGRPFTVSYLVNTIGYSPEQAVSMTTAASRVTPEKADSVIKLLKHYGLSEPSIYEIFKKCPKLVSQNAQTLLPKLDFLGSIGISGTVLARLLRMKPIILTYSLERSIRPCYHIIKSVSTPQEKVPYCFQGMLWVKVKVFSNVARSILILRAYQVPDSSFQLWDPYCLFALSSDSDKVKENVKRVMSMGIDPSCALFMKALYVMLVTDTTKWEQKMDLYRKWGWTEHDVLLAFRKSPLFMCLREKILLRKLEFYMNTMGCQTSDVAGCPKVLYYSLEKRIIPRCSVIRLLQLQGLIAKEDVSIHTVLQRRENWFLETFVIKYQEQVPELLSIFQGKIGLAELGLGFVTKNMK